MREVAALRGGGAGSLLGGSKGDVVGVGPEAHLQGHGDNEAEQEGGQRDLDRGLRRLAARTAQWNEGSIAVTWVATSFTIGLNSV